MSTPVPREHLARIMRAGLIAPSGLSKQTAGLIAADGIHGGGQAAL